MASLPTDNPLPAVLAQRSFRSLTATRVQEWGIVGWLASCTLFTLLITNSIVVLLVGQTIESFRMPETRVSGFLFGLKWNSTLGAEKHFGIWPSCWYCCFRYYTAARPHFFQKQTM